ncbi:MAG TPA: hypothetical protein VNI55_09485 [Gaiellaceae bacterium]|nr:hypothetical protein [Gaiellaceae bacterium]
MDKKPTVQPERHRYLKFANLDRTRAGIRLASSPGVGAVHDKDGWLGSAGIFQRLREEGNLSLRVWGSIPTGAHRRS